MTPAPARQSVARLSPDRDWSLPTPTVLQLRDGLVTSSARGYIKLPTPTTTASPPPDARAR